MRARDVTAMSVVLALAGCAHKPMAVAGCNLPMTPLEVAVPATGAVGGLPSPYERLIEGALQPPPGAVATTAPAVALFLSGGSQNGAFGAGMLDEWRSRGNALPPFRVVTGISTGALIGTMVFTGASLKAIDGYDIGSEDELLKVRSRNLVGQVIGGGAADLTPLRRKLSVLLDDGLMTAIADADAQGRKFLVGVTNVRSGEALAVDMTALAGRWKGAPRDREQIKTCYIEALIASSSVPLAAPPVYVDTLMLIDGGARFGVFRAAEARVMARLADRTAARTGPAPLAFTIINGSLGIAGQCPFETDAANPDAPCPESGTLRKWDVLSLGLRSVDILTNEVYRFSAKAAAGDGHFAQIEPDAALHPWTEAGATRTCAQWLEIDNADKPPPVQFHKRYMRCLISYGRTRMDGLEWWKLVR